GCDRGQPYRIRRAVRSCATGRAWTPGSGQIGSARMAGGDVDPFAILRAWNLPVGAAVERTRRGTNNLTWIVRLLGSFGSPVASGETLVPVPPATGAARPALAALFPLIPGEHPTRGEPAVARACGAALAELDVALARLSPAEPPVAVPPRAAPPETVTHSTYG